MLLEILSLNLARQPTMSDCFAASVAKHIKTPESGCLAARIRGFSFLRFGSKNKLARINVEDEFYLDPRFRALIRKIGDEDKAVGMCLRLWRVAQKYWGKDHTPIPYDVFKLEGLEDLLEVGLAEKSDEGIYARGSKDRFDWYRQKIEAGRKGGLKSAEQRQAKPKHPLEEIQASAQVSLEKTQAKTNPPVLVPAPVLVPSPILDLNCKSVCLKPNDDTHTENKIDLSEADYSLAKKWRQWAASANHNVRNKPISYFAEHIAKAKLELNLTDLGAERLLNESMQNVWWSPSLPDPKQILKVCSDGVRAGEQVIRDALKAEKKRR